MKSFNSIAQHHWHYSGAGKDKTHTHTHILDDECQNAIFIEMAKHIVIRNLMCNLKNEISKYILQLAMQFSINLELFRLGILGRTLLYL